MMLWRRCRAKVEPVLSSVASNTPSNWDINRPSISVTRDSGTTACSDHQESKAHNVLAREQ